MREDAPDEARVAFIEECTLMAQLRHANIVGMIGVVTKGLPLPMLVVLE